MAYMTQDKKAIIADALKLVVPKGWKYTLGVRDHSTIVFTLVSAPVNVLADTTTHRNEAYLQVNEFYLENQFKGDLLEVFTKIRAALNTGNHDNSDSMSDYFDVGHYVNLNIGRWDKPFVVKN